jgi:hypothetical protein
MNLRELAAAAATTDTNHSVLIYGPPKGGKTLLVGTAASIPEIHRIYWFDLENGVETLIHMGLTGDELDKITLFKVRDSRDVPIAIETVLKAFTSKTPVKICERHGRVDCVDCVRSKSPTKEWCLSMCTHNDLVVLDSGSQLGDSALAAVCLGKPSLFKPGYDEYGPVNKWLGDFLSVVQQATNTNFAVITHEIALENDEGKDQIFPLMGSKAFSMKCAKFFGTVCYVHKKLNKHVAGSSSTYRGDVLTGSRVNAAIEKTTKPDMRTILIDSGIIRTGSASAPQIASSNVVPIIHSAEAEAPKEAKPKQPTLAERIAIQKAKKQNT